MTTVHTKVTILGGDPVVGEALEVLLQAAGYDARFQPEPSAAGLGELLKDSRLLLVAPGLSAECRKALVDMAVGPAKKIPVLELIPADGGEAVDIQGVDTTPWPCPQEELQRKIRASMLAQG